MNDEIVEEVRRERDQYAKQFDYDVRRLSDDLRKRESASGRRYIVLLPKEPREQRRASPAA